MLNATKVPVVDQYAVQKQSQQENRTNPEKQGINKKQKQQTNKPKPQPKQTPDKKDREGIATSSGNYMHDDILCVILRMAQNKTQNRTNQKHTKGPRWWVIEATKLHAETRDPPS